MTESCLRLDLKDKVLENMDALQAQEHFETGLDLGNTIRKQYFGAIDHVRDAKALDCCA
jgi:hypothetical protein